MTESITLADSAAASEAEDGASMADACHVTVSLFQDPKSKDEREGGGGERERCDKRRRSSKQREGNVKKHQNSNTNAIPVACIRLQYGAAGMSPYHTRSLSESPRISSLHASSCKASPQPNLASDMHSPGILAMASHPQLPCTQLHFAQHAASSVEDDGMDVDPTPLHLHGGLPTTEDIISSPVLSSVLLQVNPQPHVQHEQTWPHPHHGSAAFPVLDVLQVVRRAASRVQLQLGLAPNTHPQAPAALETEEDMGQGTASSAQQHCHASQASQDCMQGAFDEQQQQQRQDQSLEGPAHPEEVQVAAVLLEVFEQMCDQVQGRQGEGHRASQTTAEHHTDLPGMLRKAEEQGRSEGRAAATAEIAALQLLLAAAQTDVATLQLLTDHASISKAAAAAAPSPQWQQGHPAITSPSPWQHDSYQIHNSQATDPFFEDCFTDDDPTPLASELNQHRPYASPSAGVITDPTLYDPLGDFLSSPSPSAAPPSLPEEYGGTTPPFTRSPAPSPASIIMLHSLSSKENSSQNSTVPQGHASQHHLSPDLAHCETTTSAMLPILRLTSAYGLNSAASESKSQPSACSIVFNNITDNAPANLLSSQAINDAEQKDTSPSRLSSPVPGTPTTPATSGHPHADSNSPVSGLVTHSRRATDAAHEATAVADFGAIPFRLHVPSPADHATLPCGFQLCPSPPLRQFQATSEVFPLFRSLSFPNSQCPSAAADAALTSHGRDLTDPSSLHLRPSHPVSPTASASAHPNTHSAPQHDKAALSCLPRTNSQPTQASPPFLATAPPARQSPSHASREAVSKCKEAVLGCLDGLDEGLCARELVSRLGCGEGPARVQLSAALMALMDEFQVLYRGSRSSAAAASQDLDSESTSFVCY